MIDIIQLARKKGWDGKVYTKRLVANLNEQEDIDVWMVGGQSLNDLLADEGFVKALFGEEEVKHFHSGFKPSVMYKAHCRALSTIYSHEERIKYIKEHMV